MAGLLQVVMRFVTDPLAGTTPSPTVAPEKVFWSRLTQNSVQRTKRISGHWAEPRHPGAALRRITPVLFDSSRPLARNDRALRQGQPDRPAGRAARRWRGGALRAP